MGQKYTEYHAFLKTGRKLYQMGPLEQLLAEPFGFFYVFDMRQKRHVKQPNRFDQRHVSGPPNERPRSNHLMLTCHVKRAGSFLVSSGGDVELASRKPHARDSPALFDHSKPQKLGLFFPLSFRVSPIRICDFRNRILTKRLQELNWRSGSSIHTNFHQIRREIFEVSRAFTCIYFSWVFCFLWCRFSDG